VGAFQTARLAFDRCSDREVFAVIGAFDVRHRDYPFQQPAFQFYVGSDMI
jgi:hypothetical protein